MNWYLFAIGFYAVLLIAIGWFIGKRVTGAGAFFVAGRNLDSTLLFTSLIAANIGAGSTVGVAGIGYQYGISSWWWIGSSAIGSLLLAYWVGPKIWRVATKYNLYTLGDYLELRYCRTFRGLISGMMAVGTLALFAGQLIGIAWILTVIAGLDRTWGIIMGSIVVTLYFSAGGLLSATIVNLVEIVVIFAGFLVAAPYALSYVGGWENLHAMVAANHANATMTANYFTWDGIGATTILGYLIMLVPAFCISPGLIGKVYGARDEKTVRVGTAMNAFVQFGFAFLPAIIGMCAFAAFPQLSNREMAMPFAMKEMMPLGVSALALAAIFAAEVSTADAVLYMLTTSIAKDLYQTFFRPDLSDEQLLSSSRKITMVCGLLGIVLALLLPNILTALQIFYSLMSVSLAAPLLFGLFSKRASSAGALTAATGGIALTLVLQFANNGKGVWILNAASTGIIFALLLMALSLFWMPKKSMSAGKNECEGE